MMLSAKLFAVALLACMLSACGALQFLFSGGDIDLWKASLSVSNPRPQVGEEIEVYASVRSTSSTERDTSLWMPGFWPSYYNFSATAGKFRDSDAQLNEIGISSSGSNEIMTPSSMVYWTAPDIPGKVFIKVGAYDTTTSVKVIVQPAP